MLDKAKYDAFVAELNALCEKYEVDIYPTFSYEDEPADIEVAERGGCKGQAYGVQPFY